jgi:hypothetical protein
MSLNLSNNPSQQTAPDQEATLKAKLEAVRVQLRLVQRDIQAVEGRFLDFDSADALQRLLHHSIRQLEAVTLQVAVMERRATHNG